MLIPSAKDIVTPFVVGVTGHRDIPPDYISTLERQVGILLSDIKTQHPQCPITILSSLAEGADQLCAYAALDAGLRLVAPLPMDANEYRKDFSEQAALEFDRLCSLADDVFIVTPNEPVPPRPERGFYYRQAGLYVVKHSHVLIALWDGVKNDTTDGAGTYETVKSALSADSITEVWQIVTPRKANSSLANAFSVVNIKRSS